MPDRWVIDPDHPEGHAVAMTAKEAARHERDRKDAEREQAREDETLAQRRQQDDEAAMLADALRDGTATEEQHRRAVELCLRMHAR